MNPVKIVIGFVPFVLFTVLVDPLGVGWAGVTGLVAALALVAVTRRSGLKTLPVTQGVLLLAITTIGFLGNGDTTDFLADYARGLALLVLGVVIIATAARHPFAEQFAREAVPASRWHSKAFLDGNRRVSLVWGAAVLVLGACHTVSPFLADHDAAPVVELLIRWVVPLLAFAKAITITRSTYAEAPANA